MNTIYSPYALPVSTMVQEYKLIEILGIGNFGIVYRAQNKYFSEIVAVKEFLPTFLACRPEGQHRVQPLSPKTDKAYQFAKHKFLQEAKTLRELGHPVQHPNIVRVIQFIEANDTAYMVMDFEKGLPLDKILKERGTLPEKEILSILNALLDGLERVHATCVWHRDIKPSNILIRSDGSPVLIDFGAARKDITGTDQSEMSIFSPAFAAPEQIHPVDDQGPWTDIYSLGATLYVAVTGKRPTNATHRIQNKKEYIPAAKAVERDYSQSFLNAIDAALELRPKSRPQTIVQWKEQFRQNHINNVSKTVILPSAQKPLKMKYWKYPKFRSVLAALLIIIAALLTYLLLYQTPKSSPPSIAETPTNKEDEIADKDSLKTAVTDKPSDEKIPTPIKASLKIDSMPPAALVFLNGKFKGITPMETVVTKGSYSLRLRLEDHYDWKSILLVEEEGIIPIRIPLLNK